MITGTAAPRPPATGSPPHLTRTLVRLKLRLMANRARRSWTARLQLAAAALFALVCGGLLAFGVAAAGIWGSERVGRTTLVVGASAMAVAWVFGPLLTMGTDETVDPGRLVLFPLAPRALARGLLAAALVGPAPALAVVAALGAVVGFAAGGGWIVVPAAGLLVLFCASAARTLSTVLAARLTSRRGRDLTLIVASLIGLSAQGVRFVRFDSVTVSMVDSAVDALRWLPPGMLGQAVIDGRAGRLPLALAELVPTAVLIPLLLHAWARALDRSMTVVADGSTPPNRRRRAPRALPLIPARLPWLADRPWGAVAARELRYAAREPRRKVLLLNSVVIGAGLTLWAALSGGHDSRTVLLATAASYIAVVNTINQVGIDGGARWMDVVAGDTARATLLGKNVAVALQIMPIVALIAAVTAAITGGWVLLPAALVLSLAGLGAGLGVGNVVSVLFPVAPPPSQNPFASRGAGTGCGTMLALTLCVLVQNVLLGPIAGAALIAALVAPAWLALVVPVAAVYGAGIWWAGLAVATPRLADRQAEILAIVDPVRGA